MGYLTIGAFAGLLITWIIKITIAFLIFIVGKWLSGKIADLSAKAMKKANMDETLVKFLRSTIYIVLLVMVIITVLGTLGINTTSFAAIIGAFGLAIGFALQSNISNIGAGILLIILKPFGKGDFVEIAGTSGVVKEIGIVTTVLKTLDNTTVFVPNGNIIGGNIKNYSLEDTRMVDLTIGIGYEDDIKKAKNVLMKILEENEMTLKEPAPSVGVSELADSSVNFFVRAWTKKENYWPLRSYLLEKIKEEFDKEGISIPYPQMDIHAEVKK